MKKIKHRPNGFTIVELLVVVGSLALILYATTSFLLSSLSNSGKAENLKEVRQNGESAIKAIRSLLLTSSGVTGSGCYAVEPAAGAEPQSISLVRDNNEVTIACLLDEDGMYLASNSARLIDNGVTIHQNTDSSYDCYIYCLQPPGGSAIVKLRFTLDLANQSGLKPKEQISQTFDTSISLLGL